LKKERSRKYRRLQLLRIGSQVFFLGLFIYLFTVTHYTGKDYIGPVEGMFHFDPLITLAVFIASKSLFLHSLLALATIAVTVVLGRVFCGWFCPLGAVHQFFSWAFKKTKFLRPKVVSDKPLAAKYYVLIFGIIAAIFGLNLFGYLDPFAFLHRSFAVGVFPSATVGTTAALGFLYTLKLGFIADPLMQFIQNLTLNGVFRQGFLIGLVFFGAMALNMWRERYWCRYVCPLGALLGFFSLANVVKPKVDENKCIKCNLCTLQCETQAEPWPEEEWKKTECIYCMTCGAVCPTAAITFPAAARVARKQPSVSLKRRQAILASIGALAALPLFRLTPAASRTNAKLIRPPGALPEKDFLAKCIKCGECMKACPNNALQPALSEGGPEAVWTPVLVPRIGYCEYYCSLCTQVCPTGAIKELKIEDKVKVKIGSAWINKNRCLPYALGRPCIVCEEHCPTSPKAIKFVMVETKLPDGTVATQKAPVIDLDLCIGCGICENKCPVVDDPAIYVTSVGEQRSQKNRLLLDVNKTDTSPY
jgi:MauM/NapG family ferredoxin protein